MTWEGGTVADAAALRRPRDGWRYAARGIGQLLITAGLVILLFVVYELWVTGLYTRAAQHRLEHQLEQQWARHGGGGINSVDIAHVPLGSGLAILRIPRFGRGYHMVIVQGVEFADLQKGPGHQPGTALPGQVGNFYVAGHRTTYLAPFNHIDELRPGDPLVIETRTTWFTYTVETIPAGHGYPRVPWQEIVAPTDIPVTYPVPDQPDPSARPTLRLLTFSSCNPKYSAAQRIVIHARLTSALPKSRGVLPPALVG
jgi:sortase A